MYNATYGKENLTFGTGARVLVTGWTPVERVTSKLKKEQFAVAGSLYNNRVGLDYLVANLLANPSYNQVSILSATRQDRNSQAAEALYCLVRGMFVKSSEDEDWTVYNEAAETVGRVNKCFPQEALKSLQGIDATYYTGNDALEMLIADCNRTETVSSTRERWDIEIPPPTENAVIPANVVGHTIQRDTVYEAWLEALHFIRSSGRIANGRQEVINLTSVIDNEPAGLEGWHSNMPVSKENLDKYVDDLLYPKEELNPVTYTYGERLSYYIPDDLWKFDGNEESTQVFIPIWLNEDNYLEQPPCMVGIWLRLLDNKLTMVANFRSHDIYGAYCQNLIGLRNLMSYVCDYLKEVILEKDIVPGQLIVNSLSAHIYEGFIEAVNEVTQEHRLPRQHYNDPAGNFVIKGDGKDAVFEHYSKNGEYIRTLRIEKRTSYTKVAAWLLEHNPTIQPLHLVYLVLEFEKLGKLGVEYRQDQ